VDIRPVVGSDVVVCGQQLNRRKICNCDNNVRSSKIVMYPT
jgi:hypothetical protein